MADLRPGGGRVLLLPQVAPQAAAVPPMPAVGAKLAPQEVADKEDHRNRQYPDEDRQRLHFFVQRVLHRPRAAGWRFRGHVGAAPGPVAPDAGRASP